MSLPRQWRSFVEACTKAGLADRVAEIPAGETASGGARKTDPNEDDLAP